MSKLDEIKSSFEKDLDNETKAHQQQTDAELKKLSEALRRLAIPVLPPDVNDRIEEFDRRTADYHQNLSFGSPTSPASAIPTTPPIHAQMSLNEKPELHQLDLEFLNRFYLGDFGFRNRLDYPTMYCDTPEEFYTPLSLAVNRSPLRLVMDVMNEIRQAKEAAEHGSGILGVNIPGDGCYINGWLFGFRNRCTPGEAWDNLKIKGEILKTAAHEKLGHGFLTEYSELGKLNKQMGLELIRLALEFGIRPAEDPLSQLRQMQKSLLFNNSKLLEEGWSEWIEAHLPSAIWNIPVVPPLRLDLIFNAVAALPAKTEDGHQAREVLLRCLAVLFTDSQVSQLEIFDAIKAIGQIDKQMDVLFNNLLPLPLRYVVGKLLFQQAERNLGPICLPYLALIAANVTFDLDRMGVNDLLTVIESAPRYYPDARLAILSKISLQQPNSVAELAGRAHHLLSFSIPDELKQLL